MSGAIANGLGEMAAATGQYFALRGDRRGGLETPDTNACFCYFYLPFGQWSVATVRGDENDGACRRDTEGGVVRGP